MIYRLSKKLADKIKRAPSVCVPPGGNPYLDWSAHVFTAQRVQYILLTNTASLFSTIVPARGITNSHCFIDAARAAIGQLLTSSGQAFVLEKLVVPASDEVYFSTALNRSVIGSMNDLIFHAKFHLAERRRSPFDAAGMLNQLPMASLGYLKPCEAFRRLSPAPGIGDPSNRFFQWH
ncbi:MAG TPA: hypothetical protein VJ783_21435 [Pirellulales bacterium]|nr:hypothetical protein [Pirellulales bacterium]